MDKLTKKERRALRRAQIRAEQRAGALAQSPPPVETAAPASVVYGDGSGWRERYHRFFNLAAFGLLAGITATAFTAADMVIAALIFFAVWATSILLVVTAPDWSRQLRTISAVAITLVLGSLNAIALYRHADDATPPGLFQTQFEQLKQIEEFICIKDEMSLRETFDLPNLVRYNIVIARHRIAPQLVPPAIWTEITEYFKGSSTIVDTRFVKTNRDSVFFSEHTIGLLSLSPLYSKNIKKLQELKSSSLLPKDVRESLTEFENDVRCIQCAVRSGQKQPLVR
jgi:hypothetical protein